MSWNESSVASADIRDARVSAFLSKVYGWMFLGLLITAGVAFGVASSPTLIETLILNRLLFWILLLAPIGLVWYLSARVDKIAPTTAAILFLVYAAMVGITTSVVLLAYTGASVVSAFVITSGMFGAMAVFGTFTKKNLAGLGQLMFMGLIGLIIAMVVNIFLFNDVLSFVISVVGVIVSPLSLRAAQCRALLTREFDDGLAGRQQRLGGRDRAGQQLAQCAVCHVAARDP